MLIVIKKIAMAKKRYVSSNTQYKKHSEVSGATAHVNRLFAENKNAYKEYSHLNFGDADLYRRYQELYDLKEQKTGKKSRKDATTYCESVVAFSLEQYERVEAVALSKSTSEAEAQRRIKKVFTDCFREYQEKIQERFGLTPVGFNMHLDEGHIDQKTGELVRNIHAHVGFFNYDFEKGVSPWRKMGKKELSEMQDIADECFKKLGFQRGISAEKTKKRHLERDEFIEQKHLEQLRELKATQEQINDLEIQKEKELSEVEVLRELKTEKLLEMAETERLGAELVEQYKHEAIKPNLALQRFFMAAFNYLKSLFDGSDVLKKKEVYEEKLSDLSEFKYTTEQMLMISETKALIDDEERPSNRLKNSFKP